MSKSFDKYYSASKDGMVIVHVNTTSGKAEIISRSQVPEGSKISDEYADDFSELSEKELRREIRNLNKSVGLVAKFFIHTINLVSHTGKGNSLWSYFRPVDENPDDTRTQEEKDEARKVGNHLVGFGIFVFIVICLSTGLFIMSPK